MDMTHRKHQLIHHSVMMLSWYARELLTIPYQLAVNFMLFCLASILPKKSLGLKHKWIYEGLYRDALQSTYMLPMAFFGVTTHLIKIITNKANKKAPYVIYHSKIQKLRKTIGSIGRLHNSVNEIPNGYFHWNRITNTFRM